MKIGQIQWDTRQNFINYKNKRHPEFVALKDKTNKSPKSKIQFLWSQFRPQNLLLTSFRRKNNKSIIG